MSLSESVTLKSSGRGIAKKDKAAETLLPGFAGWRGKQLGSEGPLLIETKETPHVRVA